MTRPDAPSPTATPAPLVLPRPNPGPEPWADPPPGWGSAGLAVGLALVAGLVGLAARRSLRRRAARRPVAMPGGADPAADVDPTPTERLVASAGPVRAALVAEFGAAWASRTTEEVALDPGLAARVGPAAALALAAYLDRVDRAKFAGEEFTYVDEWIEESRRFVARLAVPAGRPG